jgi:short-subunit dehydrogenase
MDNGNRIGTALITGASTGIGAVYADRLAAAGYDLLILARNEDRLRSLADHLIAKTGRSVKIIAADLTKADDLSNVESLLASDPDIVMLVNNAGIGSTAPFADTDPGTIRTIIELNITAPTRLAHAFARALLERGAGTIINIASTVAIAPEILNAVYGGSKAYLLGLSRTLHKELADKGIRVQVVLPGATATEFWKTAGTPLDQLPEAIVMSPDDVVDAALVGLAQGELVTIPCLPDEADWEAFESIRASLVPNLSLTAVANRYLPQTG